MLGIVKAQDVDLGRIQHLLVIRGAGYGGIVRRSDYVETGAGEGAGLAVTGLAGGEWGLQADLLVQVAQLAVSLGGNGQHDTYRGELVAGIGRVLPLATAVTFISG